MGVVLAPGVHLLVDLLQGAEDGLWRERGGASLVIVVAELDYERADVVGATVVDLGQAHHGLREGGRVHKELEGRVHEA